MTKSYKGIFKPKHPKKYVGDPNRIVYRSLLERRMMVYLDNNEHVEFWASEELPIIYRSPVDYRIHRYFPDFIFKLKSGQKFMVEVKPYKQCFPPKKPKKQTKYFLREHLEYLKNQAKWEAAKIYCNEHDLQFKIFTEKDIGVYN
ncbi:head completion protein [bacterium]|nr:head completion protein [bacterium]